MPEPKPLDDAERKAIRRANHVLFDLRGDRWGIQVIGGHHSGKWLRTFANKAEGVAFIREHNIAVRTREHVSLEN